MSSFEYQNRSYRQQRQEKRTWDLLSKVGEQTNHINSIVTELQDYARPMKPSYELSSLDELATQALSAIEIPEAVNFTVQIGESFPKDWTYPGSHRGMIALRRLEQGRFAPSQIYFRTLRMEGWA
jgi:nitrogen fixation/metabolism regulation signal transduction histidine kinase